MSAPSTSARADGVWEFEEIDETLDLVPIAARRALDAAGVHLSLEGWRSLPLDRRRELVLVGVADRVDEARARAIALEAAGGCRSIDEIPGGDDAPPLAALSPEAGRRLAERWASLRPVERFAILHAARSAARRGDPGRLTRAVDAIVH